MHGNYGWDERETEVRHAASQKLRVEYGKEITVGGRKLSVGMQPEITPLGLVESPVVEQPLVGSIPGISSRASPGFSPINNQVCAVQHLASLA